VVYIAATCATQRVIVFGDPYQLAPIVKANQDLYAKRWLGRDLFAVAKVTLEGASQGDPCSALLDEQFRMHPAISVIARKHVYRGLLRDAPQEKHDRRYENIQPMPGRPLVLCDTGDANPVQERSQSGRRNTHHINCVLALAKKVLATLPPALSTDNNPRIGIVTPYRRQANELLKQINADKLTEFVRAGTVHKFQGLEFEVVIFDTVESQGADPSVHFSRGEIGSEAMRLVNVAVTRPKHKLIIVANFQWLRANLAKSDILMLAVEEAAKAAVLRSGEIVPLKR
jgi:superfamily I DNA and/or RNA helicase